MKLGVTKEHPYSFFGIWPDEIDWTVTTYRNRVIKNEQEKSLTTK